MQKIVGAKPDGAIGPKTLQVVGNYETCELIEKMHSSRGAFYRSLKLFDRYAGAGRAAMTKRLERL